MRETIGRSRASLALAERETSRAIRNLFAAAGAARRCLRCGRELSRYADPRDRYCSPCHPQAEPRPGAALVSARWHPDDAGAHDAAVELGARGGRGRPRR